MLDADQRYLDALRQHVHGRPEAASFFAELKPQDCTVIALRLEAATESEAVKLSQHIVEGFIDIVAMLVDRDLPSVCPLVHVRQETEDDSYLIEVGPSGWAYFQTQDSGSIEVWENRCRRLFEALFPLMDIVAAIHPRRQTPLARQLMYSIKMYRHGAVTGVFGLEYICKWSALEGLVCGGEVRQKRRLLQERIPRLFPPDRQTELEDKIGNLWRLRNEAVHEARAFDSDYLHEAPLLAPQIEEVEFLFAVVVLFALRHLETTDSVQGLWTMEVGEAAVPDWLSLRPQDMPRIAVGDVRFDTNLLLRGGGKMFDELFAPTSE